jgi:hypothetical protein
MKSIENEIFEMVKKRKRGDIFFPNDFIDVGSSEAVRVSLHRLEKKGEIFRIAQGIYTRPKISKYVGVVAPSIEEVAYSIAKRDKSKIVPSGVFALNATGLSTQVPMNVVFLTEGAPKIIKVGKQRVKFKRAVPKTFKSKGRISSLIIQALKELGPKRITPKEEAIVLNLLRKEKYENIVNDVKLAPAWIRGIMKKAIENE